MAVTKILARKGRLDVGVRYVLNGDKTEEQVLTASQGCSTEHAVSRMMKTKRHYRQMDGVQYYHLIQSFKPGEVTPELALEIAREFAAEHLSGYQAVIGVHVDKEHIHAHTIFNSVNADTGEKYHSNARSYYSQIRAISDRLCREHGLSVIMEGKGEKAVSYIEWLRQSRGQPTFRSMLEADLRETIQDANDIGHFFLIMEHKGYEIKHGARLGFRLRGQERFMVPGRKNPLFTEDGIRAAIDGNLDEIAAGNRPAIIYRPRYEPYRRRQPQKYTGFMALLSAGQGRAAAVSAEDDAPSQTGDHEVRELQGAVRLPAGAWYYYGGGFECRPRPRRGNAGQPDETAHHPQRAEEETAGALRRPLRRGGPRPGKGLL